MNIDKTVTAINHALAEARKPGGHRIGQVNVGIAKAHMKSSTHHGSMMKDTDDGEISVEDVNRLVNDMYKIVTPPGNDIIHVMPLDYPWTTKQGSKIRLVW